MSGFIEGTDRSQSTLFPERLDDWIDEDNPVRVVVVFVDQLDLVDLGFGRTRPASTGRPGYHPSILLKLYIYGYLNRVQSSRRLERECGRNVEVFGDPVVATALLDRLLHHAVVIQIEGASYRLRAHADLIPEHVRANAPITPPPPPQKRGRPRKNRECQGRSKIRP